ncbi:hypothetical protein ACNKHK_27535 [Shigella flexneri]
MASYGFSLDVREPLNRFPWRCNKSSPSVGRFNLSAKVLILDEPTASLDTQEVEMLFGLMRHLRDRGVSLILSLISSIRFIRSAIASPFCVTAASLTAVKPGITAN